MLVLVAVVFGGMIKELVAPEVTVMCAVSFLVIVGILSINGVLKVFSNTAPFTVAYPFILSAALERTGVINAMGQAMARVPWRSPGQALLVMMLSVATLSTFINNTPIVVILILVVIRLAQAIHAPAPKLLIPLSYATILGGTCSLVGTPTNILVDGVAQAQGLDPFHLFEITGPGSIMAVAGIAYIYLVGQRLLSERHTVSDTLVDVPKRKFLTEVVIPTDSPLIGKTLRDAGFTRARGFHLIEFIRDGPSLDPEHGDPILAAGDRLVLRTNVAEFMGLRDSGSARHRLGCRPIALTPSPVLQGHLRRHDHHDARGSGDHSLSST